LVYAPPSKYWWALDCERFACNASAGSHCQPSTHRPPSFQQQE
jgi:hypothetical protein